MKNFLHLLFLVLLTACDQDSKYQSGAAEVQILDKTFVVPDDWQYWRYAEITDSNRNDAKYKKLWFEVHEDTFQNFKPDYKDVHGISIEVRPIRSEFGENLYWTDEDRIHETKALNCRDYVHSENTYEVCEHENAYGLVSWGRVDFQSIKIKESGEYVSIMGCSMPYEDSNLNQTCTGRAIVLDDIQTEYDYRAEHYDRAIEIDFKIRDLILSLLKSQPSGENEL